MEEKEMASVGMNVDRRENGESTNAKTVDPKAKGDVNPNSANAKGDAQNPNAKKNDKEKKKKAGIIIGVVGLSVAAAIAAAAGAKGCAPNERSYTVTYLTDDEVQNFQGGSFNVKEGTSIGDLKRQFAPLDGYEVEGFYRDPDCTLEFNDDDKITGDEKIYINYKQIEITLIFHNENNPSDNTFENMTIRYFDNISKMSMPTPEKYSTDEGNYTFNCWKTLDGKVVDLKSMTSGKDLLEIDADREIDLYANFFYEEEYTVRFDKGIQVKRERGDVMQSGDRANKGETLIIDGSTDGDWTITLGEYSGLTHVEDNKYTVTGVVNVEANVEHRYLEFSQIYESEYTVQGLKADADVTEIVIPDNHYDGKAITSICGGTKDGGGAFENNSTITSVVIGANVKIVGEYAFYNCSALKRVEFKGVVSEYLGARSFAECRALQKITIYPMVGLISDVFLNCENISEINFMGTADEFVSTPHNKLLPNVTHEFVLKLNGVEAETIELSVSEIPERQFENCTSIKNVILKDTVKTIEDFAFSVCPNLANITFGEGLTGIGNNVFSNNSKITNVVIGSNVKNIGDYAFYNCSALQSVEFQSEISEYMGACAFLNCTALQKVKLYPITTKSISDVFLNCNNINEIDFMGTADEFAAMPHDKLFPNVNNQEFVFKLNGEVAETIKLSVSEIPERQFANCTSIKHLVLNEGVTEIGESAFNGCSGLVDVILPASLNKIGEAAFYFGGDSANVANIKFYYSGLTKEAFNGIDINEHIKPFLTDANVFYFSGESPEVTVKGRKYWHYSGETPELWELEDIIYIEIDDGIVVTNESGEQVQSNSSVTVGETLTIKGSEDGDWVISVGDVSGLSLTDGNTYTVTGDAKVSRKIEHKYLEFTQVNDIYEVKGLKAEADVTDIVIPDNHYDGNAITSICGGTKDGGGAFAKNSTITSVVIGANVRVVGEFAFYNCSALQSVEFKGSVSEYLGACAFSDCSALQRLTLYPTKSALWDVFGSCSNISEINFMGTADEFASMPHNNLFPNVEHEFVLKLNGEKAETIELSVSEIPGLQFAYCTSIKNVILKDTVNTIEGFAFSNCKNLANITFGKGITKIGSGAFGNCTSIKHLYLKEGLTEIGANAFNGCSGLINVILPASLTKIDDAGFYIGDNNVNTAKIKFYYGSTSSKFAELQIVGDQKDSMTDKNVYYYSQGYPETFGDGKTYWHYDSDENTPVIWTEQYTLTFDDGIVVKDKNGEELHSGDFVHLDDIITIENKVLSDDWIYSYSYSGLTKTAENTYKITGNVNITNSGKIEHRYLTFTLKDDQTYEVKGLKEGATETNIVIPDNHYDGKAITSITGSAFYNNDKIQSVVIGNNVTSIGQNAFYDCDKLTSITIPNSVISIGSDAFDWCTKLTEVNFAGTIDQWASINFGNGDANPLYYAKQLKIGGENAIKEDMTINASTIGSYAFYDCDIIKNLTLGVNVTSIGKWAFYNCSGLTSVIYNGTADEWVNHQLSKGFSHAFNLTTSEGLLTEYTFNSDVPDYALNCVKSLTSVTFREGCTSIGSYAFYMCSGLTSVTIPNSVTSIGSYAFRSCSGLTEIIWNAANVANFSYTSCVFSYAGRDSDGITVTFGDNVQKIPAYCFDDVTSIKSVTIGANVTSIGNGAFNNCSGFTEVNYTGTIDQWASINFGNEYANPLYYAKQLKIGGKELSEDITINVPINNYAFYHCTSLKNVTIGKNVTSIGNYAFNRCSGLTSVTIGDNVTSIGYEVFRYCSGLTEIIWNAANVTDFGSSVFYNAGTNSGGITVTFGDSVQNIPANCFKTQDYEWSNRARIMNIVIGENVQSIGVSAFENCTDLRSVTIKGSATSIGQNAFYKCGGLKNVYFMGNEDAWTSFQSNIGTGNEKLTSAHIYFYEQTNPYTDHEEYEDDKYWHYEGDDTTTPVVWIRENQ